MAPSTNDAMYKKDERVLCFHMELLYEAKVIDVRRNDPNDKSAGYGYKVHYKGWKNTYVLVLSCKRSKYFKTVLLVFAISDTTPRSLLTSYTLGGTTGYLKSVFASSPMRIGSLHKISRKKWMLHARHQQRKQRPCPPRNDHMAQT